MGFMFYLLQESWIHVIIKGHTFDYGRLYPVNGVQVLAKTCNYHSRRLLNPIIPHRTWLEGRILAN